MILPLITSNFIVVTSTSLAPYMRWPEGPAMAAGATMVYGAMTVPKGQQFVVYKPKLKNHKVEGTIQD